MNRFDKLAKCYDTVSQRLIDTEELLARMNKLLTMLYIDRDMFGWLNKSLVEQIDKLTDEYAKLVEAKE